MTDTAEPKTGRMEKALSSARNGAHDALEEARKKARDTGAVIEANPLAVVAGGIALGVVAGALIPRGKREAELLGPVGKRMKDVASGAADAAKAAAAAELATLPLSKSAAREQVSKLIDQVGKAMASAGQAALTHADEVRNTAKKVEPTAKAE